LYISDAGDPKGNGGEQGEVYFLTPSTTGRGIHRFVRPTPKNKD
jgi:hypothetical protein